MASQENEPQEPQESEEWKAQKQKMKLAFTALRYFLAIALIMLDYGDLGVLILLITFLSG